MIFNEGTFSLSDKTFSPNVSISNREATLYYPCPTSDTCTSYYFSLIPGKYLIEAYGASSQDTVSLARDPSKSKCISTDESLKYGGNAKCYLNKNGVRGSGGYISGVIDLKNTTYFYANIGGSGVFQTNGSPGGYNGGGDGGNSSRSKSASGGGATDIRVEIDDFWHRIIVAGGGGGSDMGEGSGGSGGYPNGQGYWNSSYFFDENVSTQISGYSFGIGESPSEVNQKFDVGGGGGGWFGGYSSNSFSSGAGGGSSFILTSETELPNNPDGKPYAFSKDSPYVFKNIQYATGIWEGNGKLHISILSIYNCLCTKQTFDNYRVYFIATLISISSH